MDGLSGLFLPQSGDKAELPRYGEEKVTVLKDARLEELEKTILRAVQSLEGDVLLMIDGLDFLLAATEIEAQDLEDVLYTLREVFIYLPFYCRYISISPFPSGGEIPTNTSPSSPTSMSTIPSSAFPQTPH